jgi:hypothetical protein
MTPTDFLRNVLTDAYKDRAALKADALQVYIDLVQGKDSNLLSIPFSGSVLTISKEHYDEALGLYRQDNMKINAIKVIRTCGWIGDDKTATPDLKWAKEFVEAFPQRPSTGEQA